MHHKRSSISSPSLAALQDLILSTPPSMSIAPSSVASTSPNGFQSKSTSPINLKALISHISITPLSLRGHIEGSRMIHDIIEDICNYNFIFNIPVAFFSKYVEGRNDQNKTALLRSDASDETWTVKMDGLKLTDGWKDFAVAHDLRIGDITVFRHEGDLVFHVTALGPSCCEIQYTSSHNNINDTDDSDDQTNNIVTGNSSRTRVKKNPRTEKEDSSSDHSRFVANVSASSLNSDRLYLPQSFARPNGLHKMNGEKIVFENEQGRAWNLDLKHSEACMQTYARSGWRSFCADNGMKQGHYTFKLVQKSGPPIIRLCRAEDKPDSESESDQSCFDVSVTPSSLEADRLTLPRRFVTANGLDKEIGEIVLKNGWGGRWNLVLKHYESYKCTYIKRGWTNFCQVNGIKAGDSLMFQLVETGEKPVLSLCPSNREKTPLECPEGTDDVSPLSSDTSSEDDSRESQESEEESLGDKSVSEECLEVKKNKYCSRYRASSSYSQEDRPESDPESSLHHSFYVGVVTPSLEYDKLYFPRTFVAQNGLEKGCSEIVLKNERGRRWTLALRHYESIYQTFTGPGWTAFCRINKIKAGDPFMIKLVETGKMPVLTFYHYNIDKTPLECPEDSGDDSNRRQESEEESLGDKSVSEECLEMEKKKNFSRCRASSSYSQDQFVRLTLTPSVFKSYKLSLPRSFTRANGIHKPGKITLLSQDGVKQVVDLLQEESSGIIRFGKGWREFCEANGVKMYESFVLEFLREDEVSPVLKFCRKVNSV
ncbi:unnamed protein product [Microthlaspi erraticum]|uniref:TF-B3 domain-containing protein n=1 Tax=Microthlaspi erraticum TaxID=1685480 RepID=A0A6D2JHC3_9BRAS|nr:unnamed protein product [Microthlaspi erraticum]